MFKTRCDLTKQGSTFGNDPMQYYDTYESPLGEITLCSDGEHLTAAFFTGQKYAGQYLYSSAVRDTLPVLEQAKGWLTQYFRGHVPEHLPAMKLMGTPFQTCVWELLLEIPYGKTVTYGELAKKLGNRMSAQAVGGAVGRNPISILVPCHRVMGAGGKLTGYAGGIEKKEALLRLEKIIK